MVGEEVIARTATEYYKICKRVTDRTITQFDGFSIQACWGDRLGRFEIKELGTLPTKKPGFLPDMWAKMKDFRQKTRFLATRA
jgi:hypothetical protein